jgi:hypothetical protein
VQIDGSGNTPQRNKQFFIIFHKTSLHLPSSDRVACLVSPDLLRLLTFFL